RSSRLAPPTRPAVWGRAPRFRGPARTRSSSLGPFADLFGQLVLGHRGPALDVHLTRLLEQIFLGGGRRLVTGLGRLQLLAELFELILREQLPYLREHLVLFLRRRDAPRSPSAPSSSP